jgi:hypothetical protein
MILVISIPHPIWTGYGEARGQGPLRHGNLARARATYNFPGPSYVWAGDYRGLFPFGNPLHSSSLIFTFLKFQLQNILIFFHFLYHVNNFLLVLFK